MGNVASAVDSASETSHSKLLTTVNQLVNINCRLNDLKLSLGVTQPEIKNEKGMVDEVDPDTLVETMNRLPKLIGRQTDQIHKSIDELSGSLL